MRLSISIATGESGEYERYSINVDLPAHTRIANRSSIFLALCRLETRLGLTTSSTPLDFSMLPAVSFNLASMWNPSFFEFGSSSRRLRCCKSTPTEVPRHRSSICPSTLAFSSLNLRMVASTLFLLYKDHCRRMIDLLAPLDNFAEIMLL